MSYIGTKPQIATTLADNIVTADKIASGAVTDPKIASLAATKLTGIVPDANAPSGSVIQVVQFSSLSSFSTTSTSFTDATGLNASITPSNSNNKILVFISGFLSNATASEYSYARVMRGGTEVISPLVQIQPNNFNRSGLHICSSKLDSPSTTASITYQIQIRVDLGTARIGAGASGGSDVGATVITLMEIAA